MEQGCSEAEYSRQVKLDSSEGQESGREFRKVLDCEGAIGSLLRKAGRQRESKCRMCRQEETREHVLFHYRVSTWRALVRLRGEKADSGMGFLRTLGV